MKGDKKSSIPSEWDERKQAQRTFVYIPVYFHTQENSSDETTGIHTGTDAMNPIEKLTKHQLVAAIEQSDPITASVFVRELIKRYRRSRSQKL